MKTKTITHTETIVTDMEKEEKDKAMVKARKSQEFNTFLYLMQLSLISSFGGAGMFALLGSNGLLAVLIGCLTSGIIAVIIMTMPQMGWRA